MTSAVMAPEAVVHGPHPRPWWRQRAQLWHVAKTRIKVTFVYRNGMLLLLGVSVVQIFMLKKVWQALYAVRPSGLAIPLDDLIVYLTLANLIVWSFPTHTVARNLQDRIREGSIVFDLMRPISFIPQIGAQLAGSLCGTWLIIGIGLPLVAVAGSLALPANPQAAALFLISLLLAYGIVGLLTILLGMIAFWTMETAGMVTLYQLVARFLSGALVPISAFPGGLRVLVSWLPFQATTYVPASIYVGGLEGAACWRALGLQMVWLVILAAGTAMVWRRAVRRVVVQGG